MSDVTDHYSDIQLEPDVIAALKTQVPDVSLNASGIRFKVENSQFSEERQRQGWGMLLTQYAAEYRRSQTEEILYIKDLTGKGIPNNGACKKSMECLLIAINRHMCKVGDFTDNGFTTVYNNLEYVLTTAQKDQLMYEASMRAKTEICELLITRGVKFIPENFFPMAFRPYGSERCWQQADDDKVKLTAFSDSMKHSGIKPRP